MNKNNNLLNIFKLITLGNFSLNLYKFINQPDKTELMQRLEIESERNRRLSTELQDLLNDNKDLNTPQITDKNISEMENKINSIVNNSNNLENSSNINSQLEEIDTKLKDFNNDLTEILIKIKKSLDPENNFINTDIVKELYSYIDQLNIMQNIALMNISAVVFILFSLVSILSIFFGEFLISKFHIKEKYPKLYKFIEIRRKFQTFYIIIDVLIITIMSIITIIINIYLFLKY